MRRLPLATAATAILILQAGADPAYGQREPMHLYGYFSTRLEKTFDEPALGDNGETVKESAPAEWSFPSLNLMIQHSVADNFKVYANLNGAGFETVEVSNMWGEAIVSPALKLRVGKIYRKFGLYNEMLDAVPTYFGIEPPELFDGDHLLISRTTTVMGYGTVRVRGGDFGYALSTDNGEGSRVAGVVPLGLDANYSWGMDAYRVGVSAYTSGGETNSPIGVGEGSPPTGVLPWMASDDFNVIGGYSEIAVGGLLLQGEYWHSAHDAVRDADGIVQVIENAGVNRAQLERFLKDPDGLVDAANVNAAARYDIDTWYVRAGYSIPTGVGEVQPYFQWDWYSNPETIGSKSYGGDNEAGVADDGKFNKATLGIAYRPAPTVAIKLDGSSHMYKFNGESEYYPELRFDVSYVFGQY